MAENSFVAERLDDAAFPVAEALLAELPSPDALFLLGTGLGFFAAGLEHPRVYSLQHLRGVPRSWRDTQVLAGTRGNLSIWAWVDAPGASEFGESLSQAEPAWCRGLPCWVAKAAGAEVLVHTSAGTGLGNHGAQGAPRVGELALACDHLNLSGTTPLRGLGPTRLGPLFPDVSALHDKVLRERALALAETRGLSVRSGVVACTLGPALDSAAERRFFARAGASFAVQGLAGPLLAAAHAGLATLAICAITDVGDEPLDLASILQRAESMAPALEELLAALCSPLADRIAELRERNGS